ncbi:MAG: hypothetical protein KG028_09875 [Actinobacteria bacterium]|nr:hypothetical protein [Actinomycetota bacterium]
MSARPSLTMLGLVAVLAACGGPVEEVRPPIGDPPTEDVVVVDPPDGDLPEDGDAPMPELPPLVADWERDDVRVELPIGWTVERCEGEAPLLCVMDGERQAGFLEVGRYPLPETYDGDATAYLAATQADFVASFRADRATGCPRFTFEAVPSINAVVGGHPGLRGGFRLVDDDGREVERHVVYWTVADGEHVTVTVPAYATDGCLGSMGEFTPEDLGLVALYLDHLVAQTPLPAAGGG